MKKAKLLTLLLVLGGLLGVPSVSHAAASFRQVKKYTSSTITIQWDDMASRVGTTKLPATIRAYRVDLFDQNGKSLGQSKVLSPTTRKYTIKAGEGAASNPFKNISSNSVYKVKLLFSYKNSNMTSSKTVSMTKDGFFTTPGAISVVAYDHNTNQKGLRVKWEPAGGNNTAVRYQYQILDYNGKQRRKKTTDSNILRLKSFKYYNRVCKVRVRAYVLDDNSTRRYGAWSDYYNIVPQPVLVTDASKYGVQSDGTMKLCWNRVYGASQYDVYVSTSKTSGYTKIGYRPATTSATMTVGVPSYNGSKFQKNVAYYVRVITKTEKFGESAANYCVKMTLSSGN